MHNNSSNMIMSNQRLTTLLILLLFSIVARAQGIRGVVTNKEGNPVPFAAIYVPSLHSGTTANIDGEYQLQLEQETYEVVFQYLGYKQQSLTVDIGNTFQKLNIVLEPQYYNLAEVIITASGEDPAYYIMRKAISMSQYYKNQVSEYSAHIYLKGSGVVKKIPYLLRSTLKKDGVEQGKYFVSENISDIQFKLGEPLQTKVISMQSSGNENEASPMQFVIMSLYDDINGIISPLSRDAMQVYRFKLEGSFTEDGQTINKIEVIPRRKGPDLYSGFIFIRNESWSLHTVDLKVSQKMFDATIRQVYKPVSKFVWLPVSHDFDVAVSVMGVELEYKYLVSVNYNNVKLNPAIDHNLYQPESSEMPEIAEVKNQSIENQVSKTLPDTTGTIQQQKMKELLARQELNNKEMRELNKLIKLETNASKPKKPLEVKQLNTDVADSAKIRPVDYWQQNRPVPLTVNEVKSFEEKSDTTDVNDTTHKKKTWVSRSGLWFGSSDVKLNDHWKLKHNGLFGLSTFNYNTVDGLLLSKNIKVIYDAIDGRQWTLDNKTSYAFERKTFNAQLETAFLYHPLQRASVKLSGGRTTSDFNAEQGVLPLFNSITTLFFTQNYLKSYEKDFVKISYETDITNGLVLSVGMEYADRRQLDNHTDFSVSNPFGDAFTSNIPVFAVSSLVKNHRAFLLDVDLSFTPRHYYEIKNKHKQMLYSNYPTFSLHYRQGIKGVFSSDSRFNSLEASVKQTFNIRMIGRFSYFVSGGTFMDNKQIYFADYRHFNNNPLLINDGKKIDMFRTLQFYENSTNKQFFQAHLEYEHARLLIKRLPFMANSLIKETLFAKTLCTSGNKPYYEIGYGLNQVFLLFNAEIVAGFSGSHHQYTGVRISIPISGGTISL
ncbi:MAG: carboxypeptidase-like regulatory domain-containing protein [Bacteroidales bacterium]|nr:carboxypeptidase-like regulatory domain-containing protein [Bacteroidales bacterium]